MNLFFYLQLKQIDYPFKKPPTIVLHRKWNHELAWYFDRLGRDH